MSGVTKSHGQTTDEVLYVKILCLNGFYLARSSTRAIKCSLIMPICPRVNTVFLDVRLFVSDIK